MVENSTLQYWEFEECKGKGSQGKPCWEMASKADDFRSSFNICDDCIVFLLNKSTTFLSEKEIRTIGNRDVSCKFFNLRLNYLKIRH